MLHTMERENSMSRPAGPDQLIGWARFFSHRLFDSSTRTKFRIAPANPLRVEQLESRMLLSGTFPTVPDVPAQFDALKHHAEGLGWYNPEDLGAPDSSDLHHYQGVARYPGPGTAELYVTKLDD